MVQLFNEFTVCPECMRAYSWNPLADKTAWASTEAQLARQARQEAFPPTAGAIRAEQQVAQLLRRQKLEAPSAQGKGAAGGSAAPNASAWPCQWHRPGQDPLRFYNRRWNDRQVS